MRFYSNAALSFFFFFFWLFAVEKLRQLKYIKREKKTRMYGIHKTARAVACMEKRMMTLDVYGEE